MTYGQSGLSFGKCHLVSVAIEGGCTVLVQADGESIPRLERGRS